MGALRTRHTQEGLNMIIKSMAGDFEISISKFEIENGQLVMVGNIGVWDARTYITMGEARGIMGKLLRPGLLFNFLKTPFLSSQERAEQSSINSTSGGDHE